MNSTEISNPKKTKMDAYIAWFIKWFPESFFICLVLTIIVAILAVIFTGTPLWSFEPKTVSLVSAWTGGFWALLKFTMQMTVLLVTGNAVAESPPAKKILRKIAAWPKTMPQVIIVATAVAAILGYFHWGLGMMGGILLGRELAAQARIKGLKVNMPSIVAAIFLALMPGAAGISGAAALYSATPNYLRNIVAEGYQGQVPELVSLGDSVASLDFIVIIIVGMIICTVACILMHPKDEKKILEIDDTLFNEIVVSSNTVLKMDRSTPAAKMNNSRSIMYIIGGIGLIFSIYSLAKVGIVGLSLDVFNFLFLSLGMVLCANQGPEYYCKLIRNGLMGTWGFILQFPFYAGIFGMISATGLGVVISHAFTSISTVDSWPVFAYIYSALLNIAVPSGGSKFVIEAPYIIPTAIDVGSSIATTIKAYQLGDATTNLIIPFFALPYLANFKLNFNQIIPYTLPPVAIVFVLNCLYLWFGV